MIQNSIEKAELGSRIAGETAESLTEIVEGINESSQLITQIAISSEEQSHGIEQINNSIDQVAQVVQQNSATAQESAAASNELRSSAEALENMIVGFGQTHDLQALPPEADSPRLAMPERTGSGGEDYGKY